MQQLDNALFTSSMHDLLTRFEQFPPGCDPDFDIDLSDLEREFAELRLPNSN
jgi:hypothetical protein